MPASEAAGAHGNNPASFCSGSNAATPENLAPLVRAFGEAGAARAGHIGAITATGMPAVTART